MNIRETAGFALTGLLLALFGRGVPAAAQGIMAGRPRGPAAILAATLARHPHSAVTVRFDHAGWSPVKIVRGGGWTPAPAPFVQAASVATVRFADPAERPVTVIRGSGSAAPVSEHGAGSAPFAPARVIGLDRVAFAVDGAESSHGTDPGMWRRDPAGPQGPMQVSRAAARDVGGGDRFDLARNRALGRAYLALLYRRYGDWADAVMAYNWGPARIDQWIAEGRPAGLLPLTVAHYCARVLGAAGLMQAAAGP
jgi:hypothetical protein